MAESQRVECFENRYVEASAEFPRALKFFVQINVFMILPLGPLMRSFFLIGVE